MSMIGILSINNQEIGYSGGSGYHKGNGEAKKRRKLSIIEHTQGIGTVPAAYIHLSLSLSISIFLS